LFFTAKEKWTMPEIRHASGPESVSDPVPNPTPITLLFPALQAVQS
jgi:hypothetical protein